MWERTSGGRGPESTRSIEFVGGKERKRGDGDKNFLTFTHRESREEMKVGRLQRGKTFS